MKSPPPFVAMVDPEVRIKGAKGDSASLKWLGGSREFLTGQWVIPVADRGQLPGILAALRDQGFLFSDATSGWPPAAVFEHFREAGLLTGTFQAITWRGPDDWVITTK